MTVGEKLSRDEQRRVEALNAAIYFHRATHLKDDPETVLQNAARFEEWIKQAKP